MTSNDGVELRDRVLEIDPVAKQFRCERTHSPFPVNKYLGAVDVRDKTASSCDVSWTVQIEVAEEAREPLAALLKQALSDGISSLESKLS
jgi:hypothetical protein